MESFKAAETKLKRKLKEKKKMKRKTSNNPTIIYSFGCLNPIHKEQLFNNQLKLSKDYYNSRVNIVKKARENKNEIRKENSKEYKELSEKAEIKTRRISRLYKCRRLRKQKSWGYSETEKKIKDTKKERKKIFEELNEKRKEVDSNEEVKKMIDDINTNKGNNEKKLRKTFANLHWGTKGLIDQTIKAAEKKPNLNMKKEYNEGRVGIQLQKENIDGEKRLLKFSDIISGKSNNFQLEKINNLGVKANPNSKYSLYYKKKYIAKIRIGSQNKAGVMAGETYNGKLVQKGNVPVWAEFSCIIHRDIPENAVIRFAWIKVSKVGMKFKYKLQLTAELEKTDIIKNDKSVACDIGWRWRECDGLRVAYFVGTDEKTQECILPNDVLNKFTYADHLKSGSDVLFNNAIMEFDNIYKEVKNSNFFSKLSKEQKQSYNQHTKWRSHKKLARAVYNLEQELPLNLKEFLRKWKDNQNIKNKDFFPNSFKDFYLWSKYEHSNLTEFQHKVLYLALWRRKNRHMFNMESNIRAKAIRRRQHIYRNFVSKLRQEYGKLYLEEKFLSKILETRDKDNLLSQKARNNRFNAAPSELLRFLKEKFEYKEVDPKGTTKNCSRCKESNDVKGETIYKCKHCGLIIDRDENGAKNILHRGREQLGVSENLVASRTAQKVG